MIEYNIRCDSGIRRPILTKYLQKTPHGSPSRTSYGVYFVDSASDWYSASIPAMMYALPCYIGPCYNGSREIVIRKNMVICNNKCMSPWLDLKTWYQDDSPTMDKQGDMSHCTITVFDYCVIYFDTWSRHIIRKLSGNAVQFRYSIVRNYVLLHTTLQWNSLAIGYTHSHNVPIHPTLHERTMGRALWVSWKTGRVIMELCIVYFRNLP